MLTLNENLLESTQEFVLAEVSVMGAWQFAGMNQLLLVAATIKKMGEQRKYLRPGELQTFLEKVVADRDFVLQLIQQ